MHRRLPDADHRDEYANRRLSQGRRHTVLQARVLTSGVYIRIPRTQFQIQAHSRTWASCSPGFRSWPCHMLPVWLWQGAQLYYDSFSSLKWAPTLLCGAYGPLHLLLPVSNTLSSIATCLILLTPSPHSFPRPLYLNVSFSAEHSWSSHLQQYPWEWLHVRTSVHTSVLPSGESSPADKCSRSWGRWDRKCEMAACCSVLPPLPPGPVCFQLIM